MYQFLVDLQICCLKFLKRHPLKSDQKLASNQTLGLVVFEKIQKFKLIL